MSTLKDWTWVQHTREVARVLLLNVFKMREGKGWRQHNRERFCPGRQ